MTTPEPSASEREKFQSNEFTRSDHADTLNALVVMQESFIYAARRKVLNDAERIIVTLEEQLRAALKPSPPPVVVEPTKFEPFFREDGTSFIDDLLDASRYRWLRDRPSLIDWDSWVRPIPHYVSVTPELLDGEIDAALNPKRPEEGKS